MTKRDMLLAALWSQYAAINPQAAAIHALLTARADRVVNDHLAFRTFRHPVVGLPRLAALLAPLGYTARGEYHFPATHLYAQHFEAAAPTAPRLFVSELVTAECSPWLRETVAELLAQVAPAAVAQPSFLHAGRPWAPIGAATWERLRQESEYAAWVAAFGYRANHFTVLVNALRSVDSLAALVAVLQSAGFRLNETGGVIKGGPAEYLAQAATLAAPTRVEFSDGVRELPGCYYEFAQRYPLPDGRLFSGFVAGSASKIFRSTDAGGR